ncbi:MAG: hypothetical protein AAF985_26385 [Bacteroidota bacterium]
MLQAIQSDKYVEQVVLFRIFDRWRELVFEAKHFPVGQTTFAWDGTFRKRALNNIVIVYYVEVRF